MNGGGGIFPPLIGGTVDVDFGKELLDGFWITNSPV